MDSELEQLYYYTLSHPSSNFIHQHVVDAHTLQAANTSTGKLALVFAALGLYLFLEKGVTGREIQQVHVKLSSQKNVLPEFILPQESMNYPLANILSATPGSERDRAIYEWCEFVWKKFAVNKETIETWLRQHEII